MIANRPLILRSNRFLGSALIDRGLIRNEDLEASNEKLLGAIQKGDMRSANLLNILLYDLKCLDETALIDLIVEDSGLGLIDLANYDVSYLAGTGVDIDLCWATFTIPFDQVEGFTMVATAYYMSKPTVAHWEEYFGGEVIWYLASVASIAEALERVQSVKSKEAEESKKS